MFSFFILLLISLKGADASPWPGPPQNIAGGIISTSKAANYIDGSFLGTTDSSPYTESRGRINFVLIQGEPDSLQATIKIAQTAFTPGYIFTDPNGTAVPTQLADFDLVSNYRHKLESGNSWGLFASGGSDSNIPFNSIFEVDWQVSAYYHLQVDALHSWLFLLNYSPTRSIWPGVPIPGLGYFVNNPENHTQIFYGIPFFATWQPNPDWNLSLSYLILTTVDAEISRKMTDTTKVHFNFQWVNELWLLANRADNQQHLIFDEKRFILGVRSTFWDDFFTDVFGGFAFDQTLLLGHSITDRNMPNINLPAGIMAQADLAYKF